MNTLSKDVLIHNYGFREIEDEQFEVLEWVHRQKQGTAEYSARIQLEREKGEADWNLGSIDLSGYPLLHSVNEALLLINRVNSSKI